MVGGRAVLGGRGDWQRSTLPRRLSGAWRSTHPLRHRAGRHILPLHRHVRLLGRSPLVFSAAPNGHGVLHLHYVALDDFHAVARRRGMARNPVSGRRVAQGIGLAEASLCVLCDCFANFAVKKFLTFACRVVRSRLQSDSASSGISTGSVAGCLFLRAVCRLDARNLPALKCPFSSTSKLFGRGARCTASPPNCLVFSRMISARPSYSFTSPRISTALPSSWMTSPRFFKSYGKTTTEKEQDR